jgi:PAS domain S-box-containing protein
MVFTALPDGSVDYVNQRWLQYMGLSLEDVFGWNWEFTIHPEDRARSIDHGSVINVLSIARDITERKRAENELRQQKEILQKIFDYIPVMIAFVGEDGRVELVNRAWERSLGWTLHELEEQHLDIYALAYPDPQYRQQVLDFVAAATGEWSDLKVRVRDGRVIDMTVAIVHLPDRPRSPDQRRPPCRRERGDRAALDRR